MCCIATKFYTCHDSLAVIPSAKQRCDMAFIEPMHRNKPNITYLLLQNNPNPDKMKFASNLI